MIFHGNMRAGFTLPFVVLAFTACTDSAKFPSKHQAALTPEDAYFEARDGFIQRLEKESGLPDDRTALSELEEKMKALVGPVKVDGFPKDGKINLQTLVKELGFGQADGLSFSSGDERLFVTTDNVLKRYLAE